MPDSEIAPPRLDVTYVAELARLRLNAEEIATFNRQLADVLGYIEKLKEVDISAVSLGTEADLQNHLRVDVVQPSLSPEEALRNAPARAGQLFLVPRMIE